MLPSLPHNWDSYGAEPPGAGATANAIRVLQHLDEMGWAPDRIAPSAEGGVAIAFHRGSRYGDLECLNSGEVLACTSDGQGVPRVWEVQLDGMREALESIREHVYA